MLKSEVVPRNLCYTGINPPFRAGRRQRPLDAAFVDDGIDCAWRACTVDSRPRVGSEPTVRGVFPSALGGARASEAAVEPATARRQRVAHPSVRRRCRRDWTAVPSGTGVACQAASTTCCKRHRRRPIQKVHGVRIGERTPTAQRCSPQKYHFGTARLVSVATHRRVHPAPSPRHVEVPNGRSRSQQVACGEGASAARGWDMARCLVVYRGASAGHRSVRGVRTFSLRTSGCPRPGSKRPSRVGGRGLVLGSSLLQRVPLLLTLLRYAASASSPQRPRPKPFAMARNCRALGFHVFPWRLSPAHR